MPNETHLLFSSALRLFFQIIFSDNISSLVPGLSHETCSLEKRFFRHKKPRNISPMAVSPRSIQTAVVVAVKSVLALQPTGFIQLASRIQEAMHPVSTFSFGLDALVVSVGRTRLARRSKPPFFAENKNSVMYHMYCVSYHTLSQRNLRACIRCACGHV